MRDPDERSSEPIGYTLFHPPYMAKLEDERKIKIG